MPYDFIYFFLQDALTSGKGIGNISKKWPLWASPSLWHTQIHKVQTIFYQIVLKNGSSFYFQKRTRINALTCSLGKTIQLNVKNSVKATSRFSTAKVGQSRLPTKQKYLHQQLKRSHRQAQAYWETDSRVPTDRLENCDRQNKALQQTE